MTDPLSERFRSAATPTVIAHATSKMPIVLSHIVTTTAMTTARPELESAFAVHIHLTPLTRADTWIDGRHAPLPPVAPGGICLFDLSTQPVAEVHEAANFMRVHLSQRTIDDLCYEQHLPAVTGLRAPAFGHPDPVLHGLASALVAAAADLTQVDALFAEYVALALHRRIVQAYGQAAAARVWSGGLAPWQLRQACELIETHMAHGVGTEELARTCGVSKSHFIRAFRQSTGTPPHRWMMRARVKRAKALIRDGCFPLTEIAAMCGFADQSHLSRVFLREVGETPARWRRLTMN